MEGNYERRKVEVREDGIFKKEEDGEDKK